MDQQAESRKREFLKRHPHLNKLVDRLLRSGDENEQRLFQPKDTGNSSTHREDR